jgi:tRNA-splicing ligase RtcB
VTVALEVAKKNFADKNTAYVKNILKEILLQPEEFKSNLMLGQIAEELLMSKKTEKRMLLNNRVPYEIFGMKFPKIQLISFILRLNFRFR